MPKATPPLFPESHGQAAVAHQYPAGWVIEQHTHAWGQLLYALEGVMWVDLGNEALVVPPQRALWIPQGVAHSIRMISKVAMHNLYFQPAQIPAQTDLCSVVNVSGLLRELITTIINVEYAPAPDRAFLAIAYQLASAEMQRAKQSGFRVRLPYQADRRLQAVCQAIIDDPTQNISQEQHAAAVGASVRTLSRLFLTDLGVGFASWRRHVQLALAISQLSEGKTIQTIAITLGYLPTSFSEMFRRELGCSPSEFLPKTQ